MLKNLPIGISDFKELMENNCYFADKSLFIKELIDDKSKVILIPRPRRFGKTLNLSMVKYFFDIKEKDEENLFKELKIWEHEEYREYKGKHPVIYISLKDVKNDNYEDCIFKIRELIINELKNFAYLLKSDKVDDYDKKTLSEIARNTAKNVQFESSLDLLMRCIENHHKVKPFLLIDEYDAPIHAGYTYGFYEQITIFMRNFLSAGLKDSKYLHKGILTGILRVAKESIFSGLNNPQVATMLDIPYSKHFGLTDEDVQKMLSHYDKTNLTKDVQKWYDGYLFGQTRIYNPWSLLCFINSQKTQPEPYWVNTSSNDIITDLITKASGEVKKDLGVLIEGGSIEKAIDSNVVLKDVSKSSASLWTFLLFSGYLKVAKRVQKKGSFKAYYELKIPNIEVNYLFESVITTWLTDTLHDSEYQTMLKSLLDGDIETFDTIFAEYVLSSFSYFDTAREPEKTYHAFVLGMLVSLSKEEYLIKSNRESGRGRYDVLIMPKDTNKNGVIIEFKKVNKRRKEKLEDAIISAFKQIDEKKYAQELQDFGCKKIFEVAIAIDGKKSLAEGRFD